MLRALWFPQIPSASPPYKGGRDPLSTPFHTLPSHEHRQAKGGQLESFGGFLYHAIHLPKLQNPVEHKVCEVKAFMQQLIAYDLEICKS